MTRSKGKLVALAATVVGISTLGVAGFVCPRWIEEEYYIRKLRSKNLREVVAAAEKLGEIRSVRAVPSLVIVMNRICRHDGGEGIQGDGVPFFSVGKIGLSALPALSQAFDIRDPSRGHVNVSLQEISLSEGLNGDAIDLLLKVQNDPTADSALHRAATHLLAGYRSTRR